MNFKSLKSFNPYLITIATISFTGFLKLLLNHFFNIDTPTLLFFSMIGFCAFYGGFLQGILALLYAQIFILYNFLPLNFETNYLLLIRLGIFSGEGLLIVTICSYLRKAKEMAKLILENNIVNEKLRASERFLDSILDNIPNALFVKDVKDLSFVRMNKACENLLNEKSENILGKSDYDIFSKDQADQFTTQDYVVLEQKKVLDIDDEPLLTKNGMRYLHTKKIPLMDQFGNARYLIGISEDITEKKEIEKQKIELLKSEAALLESEKSAEEMAILALENARLYREATEACRAKSTFLANISHEIRTPLGAMLGYAELVLDGENLSADQNEYISRISKNGSQLLHIVDEILDLSKAESDRIQIEKTVCSLPKVIDDVMSLLHIQADEKGISLNVNKNKNLPLKVITDPVRLRQILINIIGNAIKFTEKGGIEVNVSFKRSGNSLGNLEFIISDTGMGINPEQAEKLFEPFVQADESMTRKFGGTGLGLFLSRKLSQLMGGDVTLLQSTLGQGSKFRVVIEAELAIDEYRIKQQPGFPLYEVLNSKIFEQSRILVVDDSPDNQTIVKAFLKDTNIEVSLADNGEEGVKKAQTEDFDLVLMDIQMPVMDGFDAIRTLRQNEYKRTVIALTAHGMNGDREKCIEVGFDDYMCKPITKGSLIEVISKYVDSMRSVRQAHS